MALRTKRARQKLTKKLQKHLTEMGIHTMAEFEKTRQLQRGLQEIDKAAGGHGLQPCYECREIEQRLNGTW